MPTRSLFRVTAVVAVLAALGFAGWWSRDAWRGRLAPPPAGGEEEGHGHAHGEKNRVKLSPQARANLGLIVEPLRSQTYWQTVRVPGAVVERRGKGDRGVTAPIAGVVGRVHAVRGHAVQLGEELFTLRLTSESLHTAQAELNKTALELKIAGERKTRLETAGRDGAPVSQASLTEARNDIERLSAARKAHRNDLSLRGLSVEQIDRVEEGQFLKELTVRVPGKASAARSIADDEPLYEVEELKAQLGEQVQAGQVLCYLGDHRHLYVEGRGFKEDAPLLERTAANGWPVTADFAEDAGGDWPPLGQELTVLYMANALDPASQTFPFYVPLVNQFREYGREGKTFRLWRFRPGQRVLLGVRVREFSDVFVLPADAVVREGPEAFVFRQNGETFERRPVRVVFEDSANVVIANDGSVSPGSHVARNGAGALNRALKAGDEGGGHGHDHHGHSHEH
jgi:multidrug efflux pump subunit AcrA (membrane-fusion protein)